MSDYLKEIVDKIVSLVEPDKIILFGSRAKRIKECATTPSNDEESESDYDICVLKSNIKSRREIAQNIYLKLLEIKTLIPIDIIVETPGKFEELKNNKFMIYYEISKYGVTIYEK